MTDKLLAALRTVPDFPEPGVRFKDASPILADAMLLREALAALQAPWEGERVTHVVGVEARGFLFGTMLAERLGTGFVMARKPGKLPAETVREEYALEYGADAVELHADAVRAGDRVLVHDDVVATGGTAAATARLVQQLGAEVVGLSFLIEIAALGGRGVLPEGVPVGVVLRV